MNWHNNVDLQNNVALAMIEKLVLDALRAQCGAANKSDTSEMEDLQEPKSVHIVLYVGERCVGVQRPIHERDCW